MKISSTLMLMILALGMALIGPLNLEAAIAPPARVQLDLLSKEFTAVDFDHAAHVNMVGDCAECHHHTAGTPPKNPDCVRCHAAGTATGVVACRDCHSAQPFSAEYLKQQSANRGLYHIDKPGLKAAYHQQCMGCHKDAGGPTDCLDCHARTRSGDQLYRTGEFAPAKGSGVTSH